LPKCVEERGQVGAGLLLSIPADARDAPPSQCPVNKRIGFIRDGRKIVCNRATADQPTFMFERRVIGCGGDQVFGGSAWTSVVPSTADIRRMR
jgi:hypothetical protein